jgi:hypothetical protein
MLFPCDWRKVVRLHSGLNKTTRIGLTRILQTFSEIPQHYYRKYHCCDQKHNGNHGCDKVGTPSVKFALGSKTTRNLQNTVSDFHVCLNVAVFMFISTLMSYE